MPENPKRERLNKIFNLGFRRGANNRAAVGLPYSKSTPWPDVVPSPPDECGSDDEKENWNRGYRMGYVIGAAVCELQKYSQESFP